MEAEVHYRDRRVPGAENSPVYRAEYRWGSPAPGCLWVEGASPASPSGGCVNSLGCSQQSSCRHRHDPRGEGAGVWGPFCRACWGHHWGCPDCRGCWFWETRPTSLLIDAAIRHRFASPTPLIFIYCFLCIGDNSMLFCWGWGKWKVTVRVKSEWPNSLSSFGVFLPVFFFPKRLITFSVELARYIFCT